MPPAIKISIDLASLRGVKKMLRDNPARFLEVAAGAINDTAKHVVSFISKAIRDRVNIKKADVDKYIRRSTATAQDLKAVVTLSESERLSLKYFGARQTREGVTYLIDKTGRPPRPPKPGAIARFFGAKQARASATRDRIPDAFIVDKLGGHVFKRAEINGEKVARLPLTQKRLGVSPWGAFVMSGMRRPTKAEANRYLVNRLRHRMQYQTKRKAKA